MEFGDKVIRQDFLFFPYDAQFICEHFPYLVQAPYGGRRYQQTNSWLTEHFGPRYYWGANSHKFNCECWTYWHTNGKNNWAFDASDKAVLFKLMLF